MYPKREYFEVAELARVWTGRRKTPFGEQDRAGRPNPVAARTFDGANVDYGRWKADAP